MVSLIRYIGNTVLVIGSVPLALGLTEVLAIGVSLSWLVALVVGSYLGLTEMLAIGVSLVLLALLPVGLAFGVLAALV